jgi:phage baseplate assembly protein V
MEDDDDMHGLIGDLIRRGTIRSVDLVAGLAVFEAGEIVSPPLPWVEVAAGAFRTWTPPSIGEQVILLCPEADIEGGMILRGLSSNQFPSPDNTADHSIHGADGLVFTLTPAGLRITAPQGVDITADVTITGNVSVTGDITSTGNVNGDSDVIGGGISLKDHIHGNVQSGAAKTGGPE